MRLLHKAPRTVQTQAGEKKRKKKKRKRHGLETIGLYENREWRIVMHTYTGYTSQNRCIRT